MADIYLIFETGSLTDLELAKSHRLVWLAHEPQGSAYLHIGIINMYHFSQFLGLDFRSLFPQDKHLAN